MIITSFFEIKKLMKIKKSIYPTLKFKSVASMRWILLTVKLILL